MNARVWSSPSGLTPALPDASYSYLERAAASLDGATHACAAAPRYAGAHVAALQATAALLAARARPRPGPARSRRSTRSVTRAGSPQQARQSAPRSTQRNAQKNAWVLLAEVALELGEWAALFAAGSSKRAAAEAGARGAVSEREADDLLRDAARFLAVVERSLGLVPRGGRTSVA